MRLISIKLGLVIFISLSFFIQISAQKVVFNNWLRNDSITRYTMYDLDSLHWEELCYPENSYIGSIDKVYQDVDSVFWGLTSYEYLISLNRKIYSFKEHNTPDCIFEKGIEKEFSLKDFWASIDDFGNFCIRNMVIYDFYNDEYSGRTNWKWGLVIEELVDTDVWLNYKGKYLGMAAKNDTFYLVELNINNPLTSKVLFKYPEKYVFHGPIQVDRLFKIRVDCETYDLYAYVRTKGIFRIDLKKEEFVYIGPPYHTSGELLTTAVFGPIHSTKGCEIMIDLDLDDGSGATGGDYLVNLSCGYSDIHITDRDLDVFSDHWIDSITIAFEGIVPDGLSEFIVVENELTTRMINNHSQALTIVNEKNHAYIPLRRTLRNVKYYNESIEPTIEDRHFVFVAYGKDGVTDTSRVSIHFVTAGEDLSFGFCDIDTMVNIFDVVSSFSDSGGYFSPTIDSNFFFNPSFGLDQSYDYIIPFETCPNDTAKISFFLHTLVEIDYSFIDVNCLVDTPATLIVNDILENHYYLDGEPIKSNERFIIDTEGYHVITKLDFNNCIVIDSFFYNPPLGYTIDIGDSLDIVNNESIEIRASSNVDIDYYLWLVDGEEQDEESGIFTYLPDGESELNEIIVISYDENGCKNTDTLIISIKSSFESIQFPNTIVPADRDDFGINNYFIVFGPYGYKILDFVIYNRWGQVVYEATELNVNDVEDDWWDGTLNGVEVIGGTYLFKFRAISTTGVGKDYKGRVLLLR